VLKNLLRADLRRDARSTPRSGRQSGDPRSKATAPSRNIRPGAAWARSPRSVIDNTRGNPTAPPENSGTVQHLFLAARLIGERGSGSSTILRRPTPPSASGPVLALRARAFGFFKHWALRTCEAAHDVHGRRRESQSQAYTRPKYSALLATTATDVSDRPPGRSTSAIAMANASRTRAGERTCYSRASSPPSSGCATARRLSLDDYLCFIVHEGSSARRRGANQMSGHGELDRTW